MLSGVIAVNRACGFRVILMRKTLYMALALATALTVFTPTLIKAQDYHIGKGDVIRITVYGHTDLNTVERVSGGGTVNFPLIGQIRVSGMTVSQAAQDIAARLSSGYLVSPQVSVFVQEFKSQKAVIMGAIQRPGLYELKGETSFIELISVAGGLTEKAGNTAIVKRKPRAAYGQPEEIITVDLNRLIKLGDTTMDISIMDNDSIFIISTGVFYVTGHVNKPNAYTYKEGTTVIKALTMAGGVSGRGSPSRIKIIRKAGGAEKVIKNVKMDMAVQEDDVIVVPESFL